MDSLKRQEIISTPECKGMRTVISGKPASFSAQQLPVRYECKMSERRLAPVGRLESETDFRRLKAEAAQFVAPATRRSRYQQADTPTAGSSTDPAGTHQPFGLLHGGASVTLAETLGSTGGMLCVDPAKYLVVGLEINANHVRGVREGWATGTARPLHRGKTTQLWEIKIADDAGKLVCVSRITLAVIEKKPAA